MYLNVVVVVLTNLKSGLSASSNAANIAPIGECQLSMRQYSLSMWLPLPAIALSISRDIPAIKVPMESKVKITYTPKHALVIRGR